MTTAYEPFERSHLRGVLALCEALDWPSYTESPERTHRVLSAPGATTVVAREEDEIVGLAHVLSDGIIQAHLSLVGVLERHRRNGVARELIREAFSRAGGKWLDLCAEEGSEPFYRSFVHQERVGFRLHPDLKPGE